MNFTETLQSLTGKPLSACTNQELYLALLELVRRKSADRVQPVTGRKLYYISAEFLIGKLLSNNLINLGLYDEARNALAAAGKNLADIEEVEPEPSLGNGGLGRLAACFLDSLATLNLPGDGVGLRYHFGLFRQSFENGVQNEKPDPWLTAHSWAEKTDITYPVELAGKEYTARLYKLAVTGYEGRTNTLNLFDLDTIDESIVHDGIAFDKTAIDKNLTLFLYPDDSDEAGRRLRVYQQYLMVSAGAQSMSHCLDRDREMRVIRYTDCNSIDLVGHLVEHLAEILETRNFREHGNKFLSMRCTHIYITKCNHFAQTGFIQFLCDLASTVTDTDKSDSHFFVGTDKRNTRHGIGLRRNPKRRNCCRS